MFIHAEGNHLTLPGVVQSTEESPQLLLPNASDNLHYVPMSKDTPDQLVSKSVLFRSTQFNKYLFYNDLVTLGETIVI